MKEYATLEYFIRKYYASLHAAALKFVKSEDIAQDIIQETIIRFWEKPEREKELDSVENYLYTMVRNESLNYLRSIRRETARYNRLEIPEQEDPLIFNLSVEEDTNRMLLAAIATLPEQSARIIRLTLSGLENKEIARLLTVSVNTVKTLKYGAIRKLREYFLKKNGKTP